MAISPLGASTVSRPPAAPPGASPRSTPVPPSPPGRRGGRRHPARAQFLRRDLPHVSRQGPGQRALGVLPAGAGPAVRPPPESAPPGRTRPLPVARGRPARPAEPPARVVAERAQGAPPARVRQQHRRRPGLPATPLPPGQREHILPAQGAERPWCTPLERHAVRPAVRHTVRPPLPAPSPGLMVSCRLWRVISAPAWRCSAVKASSE